MNYRNLSGDEFTDKLASFKKLGLLFDYIETNSSIYLQIGKMRYYRERSDDIPFDELYIFKQVQEEADAYLLKNPQLKGAYFDVKYCVSNSMPHQIKNATYENVIEIDISSAYTAAALKLGIISKATFKALAGMSKATRLAALGSIATTKRIKQYKGAEIINEDEITKETRPLFFMAAFEVQEIILPFLDKYEDIFFYWVDAIFAPASLLPVLKYKIKSKGYNFTVKENLTLTVSSRDLNTVYSVYNPHGVTEKKINREFIFNPRNFKAVFNIKAAKEKELSILIKDAIAQGETEQLKAALSEKMKKIFLTDKAGELPIFKICKILNSYNLDYKDFLTFQKSAQIFIEQVQTTTKGDTTEFESLAKFALIAEIIEAQAEPQCEKLELQNEEKQQDNIFVVEKLVSYTTLQ